MGKVLPVNPVLNDKRLRAAVRAWAQESGRRMQARRKLLELSQAQVAAAIGVRATTVSKAELGQIVPKDSVRMAIAAVLLCEVDDIWPYPDRATVMAAARSEMAA